LRQIETLQGQYALATENWQGIEGSMNARITTLEKERDDLAKREADMRKKAREVNSKARRFEEDLEMSSEQVVGLTSELEQLRESFTKLQSRFAVAEKTAKDAREALESERRSAEAATQNRIEEEKAKWKTEAAIMSSNSGPPTPMENQSAFLRAESTIPPFGTRKSSATSELMGLGVGMGGMGSMRRSSGRPTHLGDLNLLLPGSNDGRAGSRRASQFPFPVRTPTDPSFASRAIYESFSGTGTASPPISSAHLYATTNGGTPPMISSTAPSIYADPDNTILQQGLIRRDTGNQDDAESRRSSPQRTVAELISGSHVGGAGPSVQLVERMSASVRRLEMEKAAAREEILRMQSQRDGARDEVVSLMRELDLLKELQDKGEQMSKEMEDMRLRYEAALEMLGEKSEECEELRNDVMDLKKMYRELVETTVQAK
jgi:TATA element modulatory factor